MNRLLKNLVKLIPVSILLLIIFTLTVCSRKPSEQDILARIDDRVITVKEFRERAELTPRQPYCSSNTDKDKNIILNTLIVEKILALESQNDDLIKNNKSYLAYLKGRKEQFMREILYYEEAYNRVKLDTAEILNAYELAGREYKVEFYALDSLYMKKLQTRFDKYPANKAQIFDEISLTQKPPVKNIAWKDQDSPFKIHKALFSAPLKINDVIGPVHVDYNNYLVIKIVDSKNSKPLGGNQSQQRWLDVVHKLRNQKADKIWTEYTGQLMSGKKIEFVKGSYIKVFKLFENWLSQTQKQQSKSEYFTKDIEDKNFRLDFNDESFLASSFCSIDDLVWTVGDFKDALLSHPLVLRKQEINSREELAEQFKLAVADLIKDHFITRQAYNSSIDKRQDVKRHVEKWQDAFLAVYHRDKFIHQVSQRDDFDQNKLKGSNSYFDVCLDSLKRVYDDKIEIDMEQFKKIKITAVPMFVVRANLPYKIPTPAFPLLTDRDTLDYTHILYSQ